MFLGIYRFEGDATQLRQAYDRMIDQIPHAGLHLHVCVADPDGLSVYDACPSKEIFLSFAASPEFNGVMKASGLPPPRVTPMGEVHTAFIAGKRLY
jgi:hypothetical protein